MRRTIGRGGYHVGGRSLQAVQERRSRSAPHCGDHIARWVVPWSTGMMIPVMIRASSLARKTVALAMSSASTQGWPIGLIYLKTGM